jgi:hypothetical protein
MGGLNVNECVGGYVMLMVGEGGFYGGFVFLYFYVVIVINFCWKDEGLKVVGCVGFVYVLEYVLFMEIGCCSI